MVVVFSSLSVPPSMSSSPLPSIIYLVLSPLRVFSRCLPQCNIHLALNPLHPPGPRVGPHDKVLFLCNLCLKNGKLKLHLITKVFLDFRASCVFQAFPRASDARLSASRGVARQLCTWSPPPPITASAPQVHPHPEVLTCGSLPSTQRRDSIGPQWQGERRQRLSVSPASRVACSVLARQTLGASRAAPRLPHPADRHGSRHTPSEP